MKYIFLLILLACGKHKVHGPDLIPHIEAKTLEEVPSTPVLNPPATAQAAFRPEKINKIPYFKVAGTMSFLAGKEPRTEFKYNISSTYSVTQRLLQEFLRNKTENTSSLYINEWSPLFFPIPKALPIITDEIAEVTIKIDLKNTDLKLAFISEFGSRELNIAQNKMKIFLTKSELEALLAGKALLGVGEGKYGSFTDDLKYIYVYSESEQQVFAIHKDLDLEIFLKDQRIGYLDTVDPKNFFFEGGDHHQRWWSKNFKNQILLINTSKDEIKKSYFKNFASISGMVRRFKGVRNSDVVLSTRKGSNVYLRMYVNKVDHIFSTETNIEYRHSRISYLTGCERQTVSVVEKIITPTSLEVLSQIHVNDGKNIHPLKNLVIKLTEGADARGIYWNLELKAPEEKFILSFNDLNKSVFKPVGMVSFICKDGYSETGGKLTSPEADFRVIVEGLVEKMN